MTPGPFDAIGGFSHLETISLPTPVSRDNGSDGTFAQHLSPPPRTSAPAKSEPRREEQREPLREASPAASSAATEKSRQDEVSDKPEQSESPTASSGDMTTASSQQPDDVAGAAAQATAKPKKSFAAEEEQDETLAVSDEVLLTAVVAPTPSVPIVEEPPVEEENVAAVAAIGEEGQGTKGGKQKTPTPADASTQSIPDVLPVDAVADSAKTVEEADGAQQPTMDAVGVEDMTPTLEVPVDPASEEEEPAEPVMSTMHARNSAAKKRSQESVDQPAIEAVAEAAAPEITVPDELRAAGAGDRKQDRSRVGGRDDAKSKERLDATVAATSPASPEVKPREVVTADPTLPLPEAPTASDSAAPPVATSNTSTPPTLAENASATTRLPQHLLARNSTRASGGAPVTNAEQMRLIQRVAKAFQAAQSREDGEIRLRLSPPELGSLKLELKVEGGVMTARLEAETSSAKAVILDNLPSLKERLAEQGIQVEKFDVDLMDRRPTDQGQSDFAQQRERHDPTRTPRMVSGSRETVGADNNTPATSAARHNTNDGRLNVTI